MKSITQFILSSFFAVTATQASAEVIHYKCDMTNARNNSWVAKDYDVLHNTDTGKAQVFDPISNHFMDGEDVFAKVLRDDDRMLRITWRVALVSATKQRTVMVYTATHHHKRGKFVVTASPAGFKNNFTGGGKCVVAPYGS